MEPRPITSPGSKLGDNLIPVVAAGDRLDVVGIAGFQLEQFEDGRPPFVYQQLMAEPRR